MPTSFYDTLTAAVADLTKNGYDNQQRVGEWLRRLREAAELQLGPIHDMEARLRDALEAEYRHAKFPQVERFTVERLRPQLRAELDRRILASANLIRLNRDSAIAKTLQRFQGWASSIPAGGSEAVDRRETKGDIKKSLGSLSFEERRVLIDQGHKLKAALSEIVAKGSNALAGRWHSRWRQVDYDYRVDHKERDEHVYTLRDNWAIDRGLMRIGPDGYYDQITGAGEEVSCRCYVEWIYNLRDLPDNMLTVKGRDALTQLRASA